MKRPSFFEGVVVGLIASVAGSALFFSLNVFLPYTHLVELIVSGISFAYLIYLLARSPEKVGRLIVLSVWTVVAAFTWMISLPLVLFVLVHVLMLWLVRSLYFYSSILPALTDLGLTVLSMAVAIWAGWHTESLLLSLWCFFLTQALFVFIPSRKAKQTTTDSLYPEREDPFASAHRSAEAALRKLSSIA